MIEVSKDLGSFQVSLSNGQPAHITPKIATDVLASIKYLHDTTATALARETGVGKKAMCSYCDPNLSVTPNFNKTVALLKRLGYDLYLQKTPD